MGEKLFIKGFKKWFTTTMAAILALTAINVSGFASIFAEEDPVSVETTLTLGEDPVSSTLAVQATAKEGYTIHSISFNGETIEGAEGTFTVTTNGEYQVEVSYTSAEAEVSASPIPSPEVSLEPSASVETSEEPMDEEFGVSSQEETAHPEASAEVTPEVTEETVPEANVTPETTEDIVPEPTDEALPIEHSEEPETTEEATPETAFQIFFPGVYAEELEGSSEPTSVSTEVTFSETVTVEGIVPEGTFVVEEETEDMLSNLIDILGEGVTVTKNEEKSTELGYNVYDAGANDPSDEMAVAVEGTYTHGFIAGSKEETTGWYIAIPGLDPIQWAFSFGDVTEGNHDEEARETETSADYKVEHWKGPVGGPYTKNSEETKNNVVGLAADANAATITGYIYDSSLTTYEDSTHTAQSAALPVNADNSLVIKLYYNPITYTIRYDKNDPEGCTVTGTMADITGVKYDSDVKFRDYYTCPGYTFGGWAKTATGDPDYIAGVIVSKPNLTSVNNGIGTLYATWRPRPDTPFVVEHYKQNTDGTYSSTPDETDNRAWLTAVRINIWTVEKTYTGFSTDTSLTKYKDSANTTPSTTVLVIRCDGSLVIQLFYKRNTHNITYSYTGVVPAGAPSVPTQETDARYGASKTVASNPTLSGYSFSGWAPTLAGTTYTMPDSDVTLTGYWTENNNYTVKYNTNGGNTIADLTAVSWTQDVLDQGLTPTRSGYLFNGWFTDATFTSRYTTQTYGDVAHTETPFITLYAKWTRITTPNPATPNPTTPNPGRTCQDDGYPAGYTWNGKACVCTEASCRVTPTPSATPRPSASPSASPKPSPSPSASPSTSTKPGPSSSSNPETTSAPTITSEVSQAPSGAPTPDTTEYTLVEGETNIYKDSKGKLFIYQPSFGFKPYAWAIVNLIAMVVSILLGCILLFSKNEKEEDEEYPEKYKLSKIWKVVGVVTATAAAIAFFITENLTYPMILFDRYTWISLIIAAVSILSFFMERKWKKDKDSDEETYAQ